MKNQENLTHSQEKTITEDLLQDNLDVGIRTQEF